MVLSVHMIMISDRCLNKFAYRYSNHEICVTSVIIRVYIISAYISLNWWIKMGRQYVYNTTAQKTIHIQNIHNTEQIFNVRMTAYQPLIKYHFNRKYYTHKLHITNNQIIYSIKKILIPTIKTKIMTNVTYTKYIYLDKEVRTIA